MTEKITDAVRERLRSLENDGRLTPAAVVEDARDESSPLHGLFEWDTEKAAYHHWLHTARTIIKSVRLLSHEVETIVVNAPHYVRDPSLSGKEQGYVAVVELKKSPDQAFASLRLEFSRVEGALSRARSIAEALGMEDDIDQLIGHLLRVKSRAEETVAA